MNTPVFPPRYQLLDHWRGLAALAVILKHTPIYTIGNETAVLFRSTLIELYQHGCGGVPIFFCNFWLLCDRGRGSYVECSHVIFPRRVRRIYPPYFISTLLILLLWVPLNSSGPWDRTRLLRQTR